MRKNIIYILVAAGILASCSDAMDDVVSYLDGTAKTPIAVNASIGDAPTSRAYDKTFESGDLLYAYIEAGKPNAGGVFEYEGQFLWKGNFQLNGNVTTDTPEGVGNITSTEDNTNALSPTLYWDDFSSTDYDLRKDNRGIRVKYGYCYNGGASNATNNTTDDQIANGTLTWTVNANQSAAEGVDMKHSDLLFASTQEKVVYNKADQQPLVIPYTHAMSKVTINVTANEGFSTTKDNFASTVVTFKAYNSCNVNAPAGTVTPVATFNDIIPYHNITGELKTNNKATYQAIIVPTNLTVGNLIASLEDIDGNKYDIPVTTAILESWKEQLTETVPAPQDGGSAQAKSRAESIDAAKGYMMLSGVHYILDVEVNKQGIEVIAKITDWTKIDATGTSAIKFNADITTLDKTNSITSGSFDIFHATTTDDLAYSTTATYTGGKWVNSPNIYWANETTNYFFRGLASYSGTTPTTVAGSQSATQGIDLIWATTAAHEGREIDGTSHTYTEGAAINPRTGNVPMQFEHAMSKISVNLATSTNDAAKVNLTGAKISISNLSTSGEIDIETGAITKGSNVEAAISNMTSIANYCVIPQTITDASVMTITLTDGTTYKLKLSECKDASDAFVTEWLRGKHYTYTIYLEKEKITFRALIKEWDEKEGSGNANLEWD